MIPQSFETVPPSGDQVFRHMSLWGSISTCILVSSLILHLEQNHLAGINPNRKPKGGCTCHRMKGMAGPSVFSSSVQEAGLTVQVCDPSKVPFPFIQSIKCAYGVSPVPSVPEQRSQMGDPGLSFIHWLPSYIPTLSSPGYPSLFPNRRCVA